MTAHVDVPGTVCDDPAVSPAGRDVAPPMPPELVGREVDTLPRQQILLEHGPFAVLCVSAAQAPAVLWELGRLRELTFRRAGEGSGRALDLDAFDDHYLHLVAWSRVHRSVVGAYRMGPTEPITATQGVQGMYTRSLWRYEQALLERIGPALELGRSFVHPDFQRSPILLSLLWRGVGAWLVRNPQVRTLLGPVSIDRRYREASIQLMAGHLLLRQLAPDLARLVEPITPLALDLEHAARGGVLPDVEALDRAVAREEGDGRGIPVLLRQYLKLGAKVLSLNVDPDFANVVDAFISVDLDRAEPRRLRRFMGEAEHEGWQRAGLPVAA